MNDQRTDWTVSVPTRRTDQGDSWMEPKGDMRGVVVLPHGPLPVCDSWWFELPGAVRTRPHSTSTSGSLGEVGVPMS